MTHMYIDSDAAPGPNLP